MTRAAIVVLVFSDIMVILLEKKENTQTKVGSMTYVVMVTRPKKLYNKITLKKQRRKTMYHMYNEQNNGVIRNDNGPYYSYLDPTLAERYDNGEELSELDIIHLECGPDFYCQDNPEDLEQDYGPFRIIEDDFYIDNPCEY